MAVQLSCETCWYDFSIPDERASQFVTCPNCGARVYLDWEKVIRRDRILPSVPGVRNRPRVPTQSRSCFPMIP